MPRRRITLDAGTEARVREALQFVVATWPTAVWVMRRVLGFTEGTMALFLAGIPLHGRDRLSITAPNGGRSLFAFQVQLVALAVWALECGHRTLSNRMLNHARRMHEPTFGEAEREGREFWTTPKAGSA